MSNYNEFEIFNGGTIEDARLWGDGYDFQINVNSTFLLAEVKGLKEAKGSIRITENEFKKANEIKSDYHIIVISNLIKSPKMTLISNPLKELSFEVTERSSIQKTYSTKSFKWYIMETKTFYAVEYQSVDERQTFDIFPSLKEANAFIKTVSTFGKEYKPLFIFKADFKHYFQEKNGCWNYDDYSDSIVKYHPFERMINAIE